ncbi:MAG: response regulator [Desulfobacteraceae bacterium]|jgi:DNA-binding response OmpR family regulator
MEMQPIAEGNAAVDLSHILIVEDEPSVAKGLQLVLDDEGYQVDWAANGNDALEKFKGNGFNLVVADLRLPDMNGMEVIREIKSERPETEVVVITGYPSVETAVASAKMGVRDYLKKPFTDDEFKAAVQSALQVRPDPAEEQFLTSTEEGRLIQKREVLRVLNRTSEDRAFWRELMENGSQALDGYQISLEGKAAISSGDLRWINENIGELTQKQLRFVLKRMEREAW